MARYKVITRDNYEPFLGSALDPDDIVDREGYRSIPQQVEEMLAAGRRLEDFRRGYERTEESEDYLDTNLDPTRAQGFDIIDAVNIKKEIESRVKETKSETVVETVVPEVTENGST